MPGAEGDLCAVDDHCMIGLECQDQECKEPLGEIGEFCEEDNRCAGSLFCLRDICSMPGVEEDFCAIDDHCQIGLECRD